MIDRDRTHGRYRDRDHSSPNGNMETLRTIGAYRVVRPEDLKRYRFGGDGAVMKREISALKKAGEVTIRLSKEKGKDLTRVRKEVLVVTEKGHKRLHEAYPSQRFYHRVRTADIAHDAAVYPLCQKVIQQIEDEGGKVYRVALEAELKGYKARYENRARDGRPANSRPTEEDKRRMSEDLRLKMIDGKILIPDVQIRYRDRDGRDRERNLEIDSNNYGPGVRMAKSKAGFQSHSMRGIVPINHAGAPAYPELRKWGSITLGGDKRMHF